MKQIYRTFPIRREFLRQLRNGWTQSKAARLAGAPLRALLAWKKDDEEFSQEWDEAITIGIDRLEDAATRMALKGSEKLLIFKLKALRKEVYGEGSQQSTGVFDFAGSAQRLKARFDQMLADEEEEEAARVAKR